MPLRIGAVDHAEPTTIKAIGCMSQNCEATGLFVAQKPQQDSAAGDGAD